MHVARSKNKHLEAPRRSAIEGAYNSTAYTDEGTTPPGAQDRNYASGDWLVTVASLKPGNCVLSFSHAGEKR